MKVGIVTFHFVNNFGGALQAYALQKTIAKECQAHAEIIDYRNWFIRLTDTIRLFPITANISEIKTGLATMKERLGRVDKFKRFMTEKRNVSRCYKSPFALKKDKPKYDKYVCGSDQIWNPYLTFGVDPVYFLDFVKESSNKVSYAASLGTSRIAKGFLKPMKKYLSDFGNISVREKEAIDFVKRLTGKEAVQLIDPAFLLPKEEYIDIAIEPQLEDKYLLLYIMQQDDEIYEHVKKLKERLGLQVVEISRYGAKHSCVDKCVIDAGPREFLGLFQHAEYICTNSYHGFIFSILFEKDFCLIPCKRFRSRIANLSELLEIKLQNTEQSELNDTYYDKERVKEIIAEERKKSVRFLRGNIG